MYYLCHSVTSRYYLFLYIKKKEGHRSCEIHCSLKPSSGVNLNVDFPKKDYFDFLETLLCGSVDIYCISKKYPFFIVSVCYLLAVVMYPVDRRSSCKCVCVCMCFQRLHTEVETIRAGWNKYITHVSSEMVLKETKIITLQERETKLRTELERSREEIKR